jgi:hypothetical protein
VQQRAAAGHATRPNFACAFYCVSDHRHFPGAVALLNSLRLTGHDQPVLLVDAGLTDEQREMLADHVTLLPSVAGTPPVYLAPFGPIAQPADVAVLLDADIVVVRSLSPLIDQARAGKLVGFINVPPVDDRFFPEWAPLLGLGPLRRRPYLNAGQLFIPHSLAQRILGPWQASQDKIDYNDTRYGAAMRQRTNLSAPFYFADQDVLNAVLAALLTSDEILCLEHKLAPHPPFTGVDVVDERRLSCVGRDGTQPYLLHHTMAKPWLKPTPVNAYSRLLPRLLFAPDLPLRLRPDQVPLRLRTGRLAYVDRVRADLQARTRTRARRLLGSAGIRTRLAARRDHRSNRNVLG